MSKFSLERCKFSSFSEMQLEAEANINENAKSLAAQNEPSLNSLGFSSTEINSNQIVLNHYSRGISSIAPLIDQYSGLLSTSKAAYRERPYAAIISDLRTEYDVRTPIIKQELKELNIEVKKAEQEKRNFMMENSLSREPYIRTLAHTLIGVLVIAVLVVLEAYINGRIMGPVLAGGELEGRGYAITIAVINVFGSFGAGLLIFRYFNHIKTQFKNWAYFGSFLYIMAITYINLAAGVFRGIAEKKSQMFDGTELNQDILLPSADVVAAEAFWPLDNLEALTFQSQLFIGMGIIFAFLSALDGYFFEDRYPAFGSKGRIIKDLKLKKQILQKNVVNEFVQYKKATQNKLEEIRSRRKDGIEQWGEVVEALQGSVVNFNAWTAELIDTANHSIICFQDLNASFRPDRSMPKYFKHSDSIDYHKHFDLSENQKKPELVFSEIWSDHMDDANKAHHIENITLEIETDDHEKLEKVANLHDEKISELMDVL